LAAAPAVSTQRLRVNRDTVRPIRASSNVASVRYDGSP
jgi:hypothetical protein